MCIEDRHGRGEGFDTHPCAETASLKWRSYDSFLRLAVPLDLLAALIIVLVLSRAPAKAVGKEAPVCTRA